MGWVSVSTMLRNTQSTGRGSSRSLCHAWTTTSSTRWQTATQRRSRNVLVGSSRRLAHTSTKANTNTNTNTSTDGALRTGHPPPDSQAAAVWKGPMANFSQYSTHVEVGKEDAPVTVEAAILRSMLALGQNCSNSNDDDDDVAASDSESYRAVFIIEDDAREVGRPVCSYDPEARNAVVGRLKDHPQDQPMTPRQLLHLGSVWHLSADHYQHNQTLELEQHGPELAAKNKKNRDKNFKVHNRVKPKRLSLSNATMVLGEGDYLRIHHTPRRFPMVYRADWSFPAENNNTDQIQNQSQNQNLSGGNTVVVRQRGPGYCIIDKPPLIPVHPTIDNAIETVASQLALALEDYNNDVAATNATAAAAAAAATNTQRNETNATTEANPSPPYLVPVQRIDINTSGLLVLATSPEFAAYFSELLRRKTATILDERNNNSNNSNSNNSNSNNNNNNNNNTGTSSNASSTNGDDAIRKGYKCLVCIQPDETSGESVVQAWQRLSKLQRQPPSSSQDQTANAGSTQTIIRHFLKASDRAPKLFVDQIPESDDENENENENDSKWFECLMELTSVGEPIPLFATDETSPAAGLARGLWPRSGDGSSSNSNSSRMPPSVKAVVEVEVCLMTGRTHQIRGQLSKLGFPIVGDEQYGGAVPVPLPVAGTAKPPTPDANTGTNTDTDTDAGTPQQQQRRKEEEPQLLALQCCHVSFPDADYQSVWHKRKHREVLRGRPNRTGRRIRETLDAAWWTPALERYSAASASGAAGGFSDLDFVDASADVHVDADAHASETADNNTPGEQERDPEIRPDLLPPTVQLAPGRNKYVIARLRDPSTSQLRWFVKSAPVPYHADVAADLLEWIRSVPGYEDTRVDVTGGGRIDFDVVGSKASVYGFSYRYGKGDHVRAAQLIRDSPLGGSMLVTCDLSDALY
eukprot:jgi/Psemu1/15935/gm1.15935_g